MATLGTLLIELFLAGAWVDVTTYVLEKSKYAINRGEVDEHGRLKTTSLTLSLNNAKPGAIGIWSNDNPGSPYFGLLVPGVPIRITRGSSIRCVMQVRSWPQRWGHAETAAYVPITATGILGQLAQGGKALDSPVYRDTMRRHNDPYRVVYWSMEEESSATGFASPHIGAVPLIVENPEFVDWAAFSSPGSRNLPTMQTGSRLHALVPSYSSTVHKVVQLWNTPASSLADLTVMCRMFFSGSNVAFVDLVYGTISSGSLKLIAYDALGVQLDATGFGGFAIDGTHFLTSLEFTKVGSDTEVDLIYQAIDVSDPDPGSQISDTWTGIDLGTKITDILLAPAFNFNGVTVGHLSVSNSVSGVSGLADATVGHVGETAAARISRLGNEEGLTVGISGQLSLALPMGVQGRDTLINLLSECATVDQGILRENRTVYAITYRVGYTLTNQHPALALDYSAGHFFEMPESDTDDFLLHNDVTVRRANGGGFARAAIEDGPRSVDAVGTYDRGPVAANAETDNQLPHLAGWISNIRSPIDRRWTKISVELARTDISTDLRDDVHDVGIGDVVSLANMPIFVAPETHYAMVRGWRETGDKFIAHHVLYTTPYWPYEVLPVETSGSTLVYAVNAAATTWKLATSLGPEWDTSYEPYHLQASLEAVSVTTMADDTPTHIATGTASTANGADTTPSMPAGITVDIGQSLILASWTDAAAGTINTPTGWELIGSSASGKLRVFHKYYVTGDAAPTVSVTGDAAGDINISQIDAWSGLSKHLGCGADKAIPAVATQVNASAANMATPALEVHRTGVGFLFASRSEDWVSVAPPTGWTEIGEPDDGTGNRSGMSWAYKTGVSTDIAADAFVVTGGVAGTGESIALLLRPTQTATVVRDINGVNVSQSAGAAVTTWRLGVSAL